MMHFVHGGKISDAVQSEPVNEVLEQAPDRHAEGTTGGQLFPVGRRLLAQRSREQHNDDERIDDEIGKIDKSVQSHGFVLAERSRISLAS